jgi:hypothetical protein
MSILSNVIDLVFLFILILVLILILKWNISTLKTFFGGFKTKVKNLTESPRTKSEAYAIKLLEKITGEKFPTVNPSWLNYNGKTLELDGYNSNLKLALEFSGPLHRKWYPGVETYEKYLDRVKKDDFKIKKCKEQGVNLIVIDSELPKRHWNDYILSRLQDFGLKTATTYLPEQKFTPWLKYETDLD